MYSGDCRIGTHRLPGSVRHQTHSHCSRTIEDGTDYMIASESVALQFFECHPEGIQGLLPGEAVTIVQGLEPVSRQVHRKVS